MRRRCCAIKLLLIVTALGCVALSIAVFCLAANYPKSYTVRNICIKEKGEK